MYLAPEGDEVAIASAAAEYLADTLSIGRLHQPDSADLSPALRRSLGEMGWFGLAIVETEGGSGLSAVEHCLFFREVGRQCGPIDVLAQCLAVMAAAKDSALQSSMIAGEIGVALMIDDGASSRLIGSPEATYAVSVTREGAWVHALSSETMIERPGLDPANSMRMIDAGPLREVAAVEGPSIWRMGQLGTAAMLLGSTEAALDMIVDYAKIRETFGRKIGSYQAVRHPCADMALRAEATRSQLWFAAAAIKEGRSDADFHLDAAKHLANDAALKNADTNIQLHGGIGVTDEHHAHLLLKHSLLLSRIFGTKRSLLARILNARLED